MHQSILFFKYSLVYYITLDVFNIFLLYRKTKLVFSKNNIRKIIELRKQVNKTYFLINLNLLNY